MRPKIDDTWFGSITVDGTRYEHDILIRLSGKVRKRKKELSKAVYGTSHTISLAEIEELYRPKAKRLIIGTGQEDKVRLSPEAADFLSDHNCQVDLWPTLESSREMERGQRAMSWLCSTSPVESHKRRSMTIAIIVHGGAWDIPLALHAQHIAGCRAAAEAGWDFWPRAVRPWTPWRRPCG